MASFSSFRVSYLQPKVITLHWSIDNIPPGYTEYITVQRSESPEGPWETLQREITGAEYFQDYEARLMNSTATVYYRLEVELRSDSGPSIALTSPVEWLRQRPTAVAREINRREQLLLSRYAGEPSFVFIRRTRGPPCTACYDPGLQKTLVSDCRKCYNTGIAGGFFAPIELFISRAPSGKMLQELGVYKVENDQTIFWTSSTPTIKPRDLLVDSMGVRYNVEMVRVRGKLLGADLKQILMVSRIPADDTLYHLAVVEVNELMPYRGRYYWRPRLNDWTNDG